MLSPRHDVPRSRAATRRRLWLAGLGILLLSCARSAIEPEEFDDGEFEDAGGQPSEAGADAASDASRYDSGLIVDLDAGADQPDGNDDGDGASTPVDAGRDASSPDAGRPDAGTPDAGPRDSGTPDTGTPDAGTSDAGRPDSGTPDAGPRDSGTPDAGSQCAEDDDCPTDCLPIGVFGCCSNNKCGCTWAPGAYCTL